MSETVECDGCFKQVSLRRDDTYGEHHFTRHRRKERCDRSGTPYSRHTGTFRIIDRDPNVWLAECRCSATWTGAEYVEVEKPWLDHCAAAKAYVS